MNSFWLIIERLHPMLALAALITPVLGCFCGALYGSRTRLPSGEYLTGRWAGRGLGVGILAIVPLLYLAMSTPPPGRGRLANDGFQRAAVLLTALDTYHAQFGVYPDSLSQLVPGLVPPSALAGPASRYPFVLRRTQDQFELTFRYGGPGMNHCTFRSRSKAWSCSGYI